MFIVLVLILNVLKVFLIKYGIVIEIIEDKIVNNIVVNIVFFYCMYILIICINVFFVFLGFLVGVK